MVHTGIGHENTLLDESENEHKMASVFILNPSGTLPFITLKGESYTDIAEIIVTLADNYFEQIEDLLPASVDEWLAWHSTKLVPHFDKIK